MLRCPQNGSLSTFHFPFQLSNLFPSRLKPWLTFIYLGCLGWGMSFFWIKIALREVGPFTLVFYRILIGAVTAWLIAWLTKQTVAISREQWKHLAVVGLVNSAIPMTAISWAELHISSGLAGMLNGTLPLFSMVAAHLFLHDDKFNRNKILGLICGFAGMIILLFDDIQHGLSGSTAGIAAMLLAVVAYAASGIYTKRNIKGLPPIIQSAGALTMALLFQVIATLLLEWPLKIPAQPMTWLALGWLGVLGMALAYQALYYLFTVWPVSRISMVTYFFPVWAVAVGALFLNEPVTWPFLMAGLLVVLGIAAASLPERRPATDRRSV
jgi:drug/metabolite transporter (DMT)-like permease